jgi:hypothetical protein
MDDEGNDGDYYGKLNPIMYGSIDRSVPSRIKRSWAHENREEYIHVPNCMRLRLSLSKTATINWPNQLTNLWMGKSGFPQAFLASRREAVWSPTTVSRPASFSAIIQIQNLGDFPSRKSLRGEESARWV